LKNDCTSYAILLLKKYEYVKNKSLLINAIIYVACETFNYDLYKFKKHKKNIALNKLVNLIKEQNSKDTNLLSNQSEYDDMMEKYRSTYRSIKFENKIELSVLIGQLIDIKKNTIFANKSNDVIFASLFTLNNEKVDEIASIMRISASNIKNTRKLIGCEFFNQSKI